MRTPDARHKRRKRAPSVPRARSARERTIPHEHAVQRRTLLPALVALGCVALAYLLLTPHARARSAAPASALVEQSLLTGAEGAGESLFGYSVALSADGNTAIVGGPNDHGRLGAVWVFARSGGIWTQQGPRLTDEESGGCGEGPGGETEACGFGRSVALSADGNTALVGSPRNKEHEGTAIVFTRTDSTWSQSTRLSGGEEVGAGRFGRSVALSADGTTALVGGALDAAGRGAAWTFERSGSTWAQRKKLTAPGEAGEGFFGASVALSRTGDTALIGSPGSAAHAGAAWIFTRSEGRWSARETPLVGGPEEGGEGRFGSSVALSADGATALVGGRTDNERAGAAWAFSDAGGTWAQKGPKLTGGEEEGKGDFGYSLALSATGETALIGGPTDAQGLGAAWVFKRSEAGYAQLGAKIGGGGAPSREWLGASVALSQTGAEGLLGAPRSTPGSALRAGSAVAITGIPVPAPTVRSVTPSSGPTAGGTSVTLEGSGFLPGATVTIGTEATAVSVLSESKLTARTSATAAGAHEVVVQDGYGASTGGPAFTFQAPQAPPITAKTTAPPSGGGVLGSTTLALAPPVLGINGNIEPASGTVYVRLPGSTKFTLLTSLEQIPMETIVDARHGNAQITTMGPHGLQSMNFYEGEFQISQSSSGLAVAALYGGTFSACPKAHKHARLAHTSARRSSRRHVVRKLWASGHGVYSTKGNYATGAVIGTVWLTEDRCDGTLFRVLRDSVLVTNLVKHKRVRVNAGHTYLVKRP